MAPSSRKATILIVEDDAELRRLYRTALALEGYAVVAVEDGTEALRHIERERPAGIILDLSLPRLGGHDLQREISAHTETRDIPIIVITGSTERIDERGFQCVRRKPVSVEALIEVVRDCFPPPTGFSSFR